MVLAAGSSPSPPLLCSFLSIHTCTSHFIPRYSPVLLACLCCLKISSSLTRILWDRVVCSLPYDASTDRTCTWMATWRSDNALPAGRGEERRGEENKDIEWEVEEVWINTLTDTVIRGQHWRGRGPPVCISSKTCEGLKRKYRLVED